jgi:CBS domain-containing protein
MDDVFVTQLMSTSTHTVSPDTLVEEAAQILLEQEIGSVVVTDGGDGVEGILTTTDFVEIVAKSQPKAQTSVSQYMTTDVLTTTPETPITDVAETLEAEGIHHMPVVDETGALTGMITTSDLAAYLSHLR